MNMETSRHTEAVAVLEAKVKEINDSKNKALESIDEKKAMIEAKKEELGKIWAKCNELREAEGHEVPPLPNWGVDHAQSLDIARIQVRVNAEEDDLRVKKIERETLAAEIADLDSRTAANQAEASKLSDDTENMLKATVDGRALEDKRKEAVEEAIAEADAECKEVEALRQSIKDLTASQEKNTEELKQMIDTKEGNLSSLEKDIESILVELESIETRTKETESLQEANHAKFSKELREAKERRDLIETAFKRAQTRAEDFAVQPDDELAAEMKQLDEDEEAINTDAELERDEIVASKCTDVRFIACYSLHWAVSHALLIICFSEEGFLENIQFDHASSVPLSTQARDGMSLLSKHCLEFLQNAQAKRLIRVREAKEEHMARIEEEEEERRQREEKQRLREIEVSTL